MREKRSWFIGAVLALVGCTPAALPSGAETVIHARFDPAAGKIPMPSDVLRDAAAGRLDLPAEDPDLTGAERELYEFLNTRDGWSSVSQAKVEFTAPVDPNSLTSGTVQVWEWTDGVAVRLEDQKPALDPTGTVLTVEAPATGWRNGRTISVVVRGGADGVKGLEGEKVECDAAFYFLRLQEPLTNPEHERAFPGATAAERREAAEKLEAIRLELAPYFDHLEGKGIPRADVASLFTFTITRSTELAMDKASSRMPLPIDLLIDPETGKVDLPVHAGESELEAEIRETLASYEGFGPTMNPYFQFTRPVDPETVTSGTVRLYRIADPPIAIDGDLVVSADRLRVQLFPSGGPLRPSALYAMVVSPGILDEAGAPIVPMTVGQFLKTASPLSVDGRSQVGSVSDEDARKLEMVREELAPLLERLGRNTVDIAWPYRTMNVTGPLVAAQKAAERLGVPVDPEGVSSMSAFSAALDFPLGSISLFQVKRVFHGTIATPDFLDPVERRFRRDGSHEVRQVAFTLTIPDGAKADEPLPVVIFGHGLMTERRFVLAVADALASRGFAAISIDFPYHGTRSVCAWNGPTCFPDPFSSTGAMLCPNPCTLGSSCGDDGQCRNGTGAVTELAKWPIIPMYQASGAAFVEVDHIAYTRDHFMQAITDLGALSRSLRLGDWESATGYSFDTSELFYAGQSLGGILGATYTPLDPHVTRSVLNVPGANLIPMFVDSGVFQFHIEAFLERHEIEEGTALHQKFLSVAHWLMDPVDPANVARHLMLEPIPEVGMPAGRSVVIQMATLDFVIPNAATKYLQEASGVPRLNYLAEHGFLTIPVEPAYYPGTADAADFLAGDFQP